MNIYSKNKKTNPEKTQFLPKTCVGGQNKRRRPKRITRHPSESKLTSIKYNTQNLDSNTEYNVMFSFKGILHFSQ